MHLKLIGVIMFRIKWIFLSVFNFLGLSISANSYEANQAGVSKERLDRIVPMLQENHEEWKISWLHFCCS